MKLEAQGFKNVGIKVIYNAILLHPIKKFTCKVRSTLYRNFAVARKPILYMTVKHFHNVLWVRNKFCHLVSKYIGKLLLFSNIGSE